MKIRLSILLFLSGLAACELSACHATPDSHYYALSAASPVSPHTAVISSSALALTTVTVPALLDRPQVVLKTGVNDIRLLEYDRWAEPLDSMIPRILRSDLNMRLADNTLAHAAESQRITVAIDEFSAGADGQVTLSATWTVRMGQQADGQAAHYVFHKTEPATTTDISAVAGVMSRLLGELADDIVMRH